jgi:hypothetical protein
MSVHVRRGNDACSCAGWRQVSAWAGLHVWTYVGFAGPGIFRNTTCRERRTRLDKMAHFVESGAGNRPFMICSASSPSACCSGFASLARLAACPNRKGRPRLLQDRSLTGRGFPVFRCELCGGQVDRVEINADHPEQSFQRAAAPGRIDHFMRALVPAVPAVVRARHGVDGRTRCRGGRQLHLALGAGVCTRTEQTLPTASETGQQELPDRRDI